MGWPWREDFEIPEMIGATLNLVSEMTGDRIHIMGMGPVIAKIVWRLFAMVRDSGMIVL